MKLNFYIFILFLLTQMACFEDKEIFLPNTQVEDPAYLYQQGLLINERYDVQVNNVTVYVTSKNKSIFKIPAGSLLRADGSVFTGTVMMEITETNRLGDFILLGKIPVSQQKLLQAQWLLHIKFLGEGKPLNINPQIPVEWITRLHEEEEISYLYKEVTSESNEKTWVHYSNLALQNWVVEQDHQTVFGTWCVSKIEDTGWYLMAKPDWTDPETSQQICARVSKSFSTANSVMYGVDSNKKIIAPILLTANENQSCSGDYHFAVNSGIKFVLISYREDGKHYFAAMDYQVGNPEITNLEPKVLSLESIAEIVQHY